MPFPDHAFDLVTGFNSFQFAGNPAIALAEARRVAKPGAHVAIMTSEALAPFRQPDGSYRIGASFRCLLARV